MLLLYSGVVMATVTDLSPIVVLHMTNRMLTMYIDFDIERRVSYFTVTEPYLLAMVNKNKSSNHDSLFEYLTLVVVNLYHSFGYTKPVT